MSLGAVRIELDGVEETIDLWQRAPQIMREEMEAATWESSLLLERAVKEHTPVGVGGGAGLRGSIAAQEPAVLGDSVLGVVGTSAAHALPVELGTRPHFPPVEPLEDWVRVKLDVAVEDVPGVALAIARKIAARGTEGAHMFERGFEQNQAQVTRIYAGARRRVLERLSAV